MQFSYCCQIHEKENKTLIRLIHWKNSIFIAFIEKKIKLTYRKERLQICSVESAEIFSFIELPHELVKILSRQSRLQTFLFRIQAVENNLCRYGEIETTEHFLFFCPIFHVQRIPFQINCFSYIKTRPPPLHRLPCDVSTIKKLKTFIIPTKRLNFDYPKTNSFFSYILYFLSFLVFLLVKIVW